MNLIPAIGAPGSLLRKVQEHPTVVIELLDACRAAYTAANNEWVKSGRCKPDAVVPPLVAKLASALHYTETVLGLGQIEPGSKPAAMKNATTPGGATDGAGISAACRGTEDAAGMPPVVLGPGGDYVRGIPPRVGTKLDVKA